MDIQSTIGLGKMKKHFNLKYTNPTYKKHLKEKMGRGEVEELHSFLQDLHGSGMFSIPAIKHLKKHAIQHHKQGGSIGDWVQKAVSFLQRAKEPLKRGFEHGKNIFRRAKDVWDQTRDDRLGLRDAARDVWAARHEPQNLDVVEDFSVGDGRSMSGRSKSSRGSRKSHFSFRSKSSRGSRKSRKSGGYMTGGRKKMHKKKSVFD